MSISTQKLLELNREGFIPGPKEEEETFLKKVQLCQSFLPGNGEAIDPSWFEKAKEIFDISPSWIKVVVSNKRLPPWQGACAWILEDKGIRTGFLQIREKLPRKLYSKEEVLSHELAHIGRVAFDEPKFEEILAYQTSQGFRRLFGPIVQSSKESLWFLLSLVIATVGSIVGTLWLHLLPITLLFLGLGRLGMRQRQFKRCLKLAEEVTEDKRKAGALVYRLTDEEIIRFSKMNTKQLLDYAKAQDSLRWQVIKSYVYSRL